MDKIIIYVAAYNAEKTLENTIKSILNQTYTNFEIYLGDNGSTDGTSDIIRHYCDKYDCIFTYHNKKNFSGSFISTLYSIRGKENYDDVVYYKYDENGEPVLTRRSYAEWICFVDSDDTIEPTYLEDMLSYAKENSLDMVLCGWNFVRPNQVDRRAADRNEIIYSNQFADKLHYYDKFMGPVWNKLFRIDSLIKDIFYYENKYAKLFKDGVYFYGADTAFNYFYLGNKLDKFGIVAKSLYNYNISDESVSRKRFHPMRIIADRRMAEIRLDFLQEIGAEISEKNKEFIMNIYFKSSRSTMDLLLKDERYDLKQKMYYLHKMYDCELMKEAFPFDEKRYL